MEKALGSLIEALCCEDGVCPKRHSCPEPSARSQRILTAVGIFQAAGFNRDQLQTARRVRITTSCARMKNLADFWARRGPRLYPLLYPPTIFFELV
jgi:hypothetical protein